MGRQLRALLAGVITAVMILSACGDSTPTAQAFDDPEEAVLAAFRALDVTSTEVSIGFDGTAAQLFEALVALDDTFPADEPGTDALVELMAGAEFAVASDGEDGAMSMVVDGATVFEMRMIDAHLYVRLDVDAAVAVVRDIEPDAAAEFEFVMQMVPFIAAEDPSLAFVSDLFAGRWVSMEVPEDSDYGDLFGTSPEGEGLDDEVTAIIEAILAENSEITHTGSARGGERFVVQVDMAHTLAALADNPRVAQALDLGDVPTDPSEIVAEMQRDGMASTTEFDVVIANGVVTSMRFDVAALISVDVADGVTMPVSVSFREASAVLNPPADHTPIPTELFEEMAGDAASPLRPRPGS